MDVMAWCFDNPSYDLILVNFDGVRNPDDPDTTWIMSTGTTTTPYHPRYTLVLWKYKSPKVISSVIYDSLNLKDYIL